MARHRKLPALRRDQIIRTLRRAGFIGPKPGGRHAGMTHPDTRNKVTIPNIRAAVNPDSALFKSILRQAGLTRQEFENLWFEK